MPPMHTSARHRLPDEVRALWVVRTSMVSPQAIERAVELAAGETIDQILESHPRLTAEAVHEALLFAAELVRGETVYALADTR